MAFIVTWVISGRVKLVNVTTGKTSAAGASVEISGGTQFYLTAPLDQAESAAYCPAIQDVGDLKQEGDTITGTVSLTTRSGERQEVFHFGP